MPRPDISFAILAVFLFAATTQAQPGKKKLFPSSTRDPKQASAAEMLEAVCPGRVIAGPEVTCRGGCAAFPPDTNNRWSGDWRIDGVLRGHFLAPDSDDAILAESGCLPHSVNWGGSFLLTRKSGIWTEVWFKAGATITDCRTVQNAERRDLLVCYETFGGQGVVGQMLIVQDLKAPTNRWWDGAIALATDCVAGCGGPEADVDNLQAILHSRFQSVNFTARGLTVFAEYGALNPTRAQMADCLKRKLPRVATRPLSIEFVFDGSSFRAAPRSRDAAALFAPR